MLLTAERTRVPQRVVARYGIFPEVGGLDAKAVRRASRIDRTFSEITDKVSGCGDAVGNPGPGDDGRRAGRLVGPLVEVVV